MSQRTVVNTIAKIYCNNVICIASLYVSLFLSLERHRVKMNVKFDYVHACQTYHKLFALYALIPFPQLFPYYVVFQKNFTLFKYPHIVREKYINHIIGHVISCIFCHIYLFLAFIGLQLGNYKNFWLKNTSSKTNNSTLTSCI